MSASTPCNLKVIYVSSYPSTDMFVISIDYLDKPNELKKYGFTSRTHKEAILPYTTKPCRCGPWRHTSRVYPGLADNHNIYVMICLPLFEALRHVSSLGGKRRSA